MAGITLKVAEAFQNDIGRGIARIDSKAKSQLGVSTGDIIKLVGKKSALADYRRVIDHRRPFRRQVDRCFLDTLEPC